MNYVSLIKRATMLLVASLAFVLGYPEVASELLDRRSRTGGDCETQCIDEDQEQTNTQPDERSEGTRAGGLSLEGIRGA